jgi:hypothetical protein
MRSTSSQLATLVSLLAAMACTGGEQGWLASAGDASPSSPESGPGVSPPFAACDQPPCINVYNNCPVPLWTHATSTVPIDQGQIRRLGPGEQWQYAALPRIDGGRVYAYYQQPAAPSATSVASEFNEFVEMAIDTDATSGAFAQNYNITYVDHLALPVSVKAGGACPDTTCAAPFDDWTRKLAGCPTELRNQYAGVGTCVASYDYCITPDGPSTYDTTRPYCSKMQAAHGYPGSQIYGGVFPDHSAMDVAFWDQVAGWNRGTFGGDSNVANFYVAEPYNEYARWVHDDFDCRVYAFSTDDHQDQAGFVRCVAPTLDIVWCPYG